MTTNVDGEAQAVATSPEAEDGYLFDIFLSYSRKDEEFAKRLEEALENFSLPKGIKADSISTNRLRVFRDKNDLVPTEGDYYKTIEGYLKRSAYLVIVCSPNARRSRYVDKEVEVFLQVNEAKRVIPVLLSGKPNNECADSPEESAFPESLCRALEMPLALPFTEFTQREGKVSGARYRDSWYTLLAKIFGAGRAEIERVDARRRARRRAILAAVSVAVIAALSVALVFALVARREAEAQRAEAVRQRDQARRLLDAHVPDGQAGGEDPRGFEWYYLWRLYNGQLKTFERTDDVAFSRDGARFATVTKDGLKVWDAATLGETAPVELKPRKAADGSGAEDFSYAAIDFAPDGRTVAYGDPAGKTLLLDTNSGSSREVPAPVLSERQTQNVPEAAAGQFAERLGGGDALRFSPDGKLLAVSYGCGIVVVYDALSLRQAAALGDGPIYETTCASFVTFSPDGRLLAYGNQTGLGLWDTVARRELAGPEREPGRPDSRLLAIGGRDKQLVFWNVSTRKVLARLKGHEGWVTALAFSPDGKLLAFSVQESKEVKLWQTGAAREPVTLGRFEDEVTDLKFSPDRRFLATGDGTGVVKLWDAPARRELSAFRGHRGKVAALAFSPDSRTLASGGDDGVVKLYGTASARELLTLTHESSPASDEIPYYLKGSEDSIEKLFFTADGGSLVTLSVNEVLRIWRAADRAGASEGAR